MDSKAMGEAIARIDERTENLVKRQDEEIRERKTLGTRIDSLETWRNGLAGAWAAISLIVALIGYAIKAQASKH